MKFTLSQIPGALPEKEDVLDEYGIEKQYFLEGKNEAIDTIAAVKFEFDVEFIEGLIYKCHSENMSSGIGNRKSNAQMDVVIAKAISAKGPALLRVVSKKG